MGSSSSHAGQFLDLRLPPTSNASELITSEAER